MADMTGEFDPRGVVGYYTVRAGLQFGLGHNSGWLINMFYDILLLLLIICLM